MSIRIVASMLTADMASLGEQCARLEAAGVDGIHWDVMDGVAVPAISFGPDTIAACRPRVSLPFEAHVMVRDPDRLFAPLRDAGCEMVMVHPEMLSHPWRTVEQVREAGLRCGVALSPGIPIEQARWLLPLVDRVLVMTVEPGFGGQAYLQAMERKIRAVRRLLQDWDGEWDVEVDGGIAPDTIAGAHAAGATTFVVGSALWRATTFEEALEACRSKVRDGARVPGGAAGRPQPLTPGSVKSKTASGSTPRRGRA